jgi:hypothetical protein
VKQAATEHSVLARLGMDSIFARVTLSNFPKIKTITTNSSGCRRINNNHNNNTKESSISSASCRQRGSSRRFFPTLSLAVSLLLLVPHVRVVDAAGFDEQECLRCVGTGTLSDNPSQSTYCVIDNVADDKQAEEAEGLNFQCVTEDDIALCEKGSGSAFYVGQECIDEQEVAAIIAMLILFCCCGLGLLGTIAACLAYCCCCAGSSQRQPAVPQHGRVVVVDGSSDNDCGALEMATTTTTTTTRLPPTYAALPTQQSSSIAALPYAQAVVATSNDHAVMGSSAKFC